MNKSTFLTVFCCFLMVTCLNSQITITTSDMPKANDTLRYSTAQITTGPALKLNVTGASQSWDYSNLILTSQDLYRYKNANSTPYLLYFFSQIGLKTADSLGAGPVMFKDIYTFYTKNSSLFKAEGIGYSFTGIPLGSSYKDDDEIYQFPLNFNDRDSSTFYFKFTVPGGTINFSLVQAGYRINKVDGWGSITTPFKTYSDVLRIQTTIRETDTMITQFGNFPIPRNRVEYKWLANGERIPVLEIIGSNNGGNFTPTQIRYRDEYKSFLSPLRPVANYSVSKTNGSTKDTFQFTDRSTLNPNSWNWLFTPNSGVKFVKGSTASSRNPFVVFENPGLYTVKLTAANNFGSDDTIRTNSIAISNPAVLTNISDVKLVAYPNPFLDKVILKAPFVVNTYIVFNASGQLIDIKQSALGITEIKTNNYANGAYTVYLYDDSKNVVTQSLIKN